jgi:hypothetical protein
MGAEFIDCFVFGEPWGIGRNFEKDTTRLAKVDRVKISPVHDWANVAAKADYLFPQCHLLFIVENAEGDVMNRTGCDPSWFMRSAHILASC